MAVGALLVAAGVLAVAAPAQAHNYVVSTIPASGSVLTQLPEQFSITTNDNLLNLAGRATASCCRSGMRAARTTATVASACRARRCPPLRRWGEPGDYTIAWQLISTDGHTVSDEIPFTWQPDATQPAPSTGSATPPDCHGTHSAATSAETAQPSAPPTASAVPLGDVLWIGGAILLVGLAAGTTLLVVTRRAKKA